MTTLSIILFLFGILFVALATAMHHSKKTYERIIKLKDAEIRRLSVYKDNIGLRMPMLNRYDSFETVESSYYCGIYGKNKSAKALIYISVFYDDKSRIKAEEEVEKVVKSLNEWKSCVG